MSDKVHKKTVDELQSIGATTIASLTAEAVTTFYNGLKVPRKMRREMTAAFAEQAIAYYFYVQEPDDAPENELEDATEDE